MTKLSLPLCQCGCGKPVTQPGNKFLKGHATKGSKRNVMGRNLQSDEGVMTQDMAIASQVLGKTLNNTKNNHSINVICINQVRVDAKPNESSGSGYCLNGLDLNAAVKMTLNYVRKSGLLSSNATEARISWLSACERAIISN